MTDPKSGPAWPKEVGGGNTLVKPGTAYVFVNASEPEDMYSVRREPSRLKLICPAEVPATVWVADQLEGLRRTCWVAVNGPELRPPVGRRTTRLDGELAAIWGVPAVESVRE